MPTMNDSVGFAFSAGFVSAGTDCGSGGGADFDFGTRLPDCAVRVPAERATSTKIAIAARMAACIRKRRERFAMVMISIVSCRGTIVALRSGILRQVCYTCEERPLVGPELGPGTCVH